MPDDSENTGSGPLSPLLSGSGVSVSSYRLEPQQRAVALIYGRTGGGKTVLMRSLALSYSTANNCPLVVVDTLQVLAQFYVLLDIESLPEWLELNRGKSNAVRVEAHGDEQLEQIVAAIEGAELPAVILAVDEVSYWSKPGWLSEGLARAVRYGRHKGISLIITARRAAETARELSGEATVIYAFKTIEPVNLDYFSRIMPPEAVSNLPALEPFYYLRYYVDGTWEVFAPINL